MSLTIANEIVDAKFHRERDVETAGFCRGGNGLEEMGSLVGDRMRRAFLQTDDSFQGTPKHAQERRPFARHGCQFAGVGDDVRLLGGEGWRDDLFGFLGVLLSRLCRPTGFLDMIAEYLSVGIQHRQIQRLAPTGCRSPWRWNSWEEEDKK